MSDINAHATRMAAYVEGKKAFQDSRQRGFNPYIRSNPEFALHWWNGWDAAKKESKNKVTQPRRDGTPARMNVPYMSKKK